MSESGFIIGVTLYAISVTATLIWLFFTWWDDACELRGVTERHSLVCRWRTDELEQLNYTRKLLNAYRADAGTERAERIEREATK